MKELLNYLKSSSKLNWLHYYNGDRLNADNENYSSLLYRYTEQKLAQVLDLVGQNSHRLAVFIAERDPLDFISAFLASVIAEVDLFIGDPAWQQREWQQVLSLVQPDLIFGDETVNLVTQLATSKTPAGANLEQPLIMIPTGGTSGKIKFAMHSWSTLTASVAGFKEFFDCQTIDSWCTLPLYHVSGLMQLMRSLLTQGNLVICPYKSIAQISKRETYFISLVPTQLQFLLDTNPDWLKEFKTVLVGGAPARRSLLDTARNNKIAVSLIYGSTETASGVVALKPEDFLTGNNSSGRVLPQARISIERTSINAELTQLSEDKAGLITIACKSLCLGYYPQLFSSNLLTTDDLGYIDPKGYVHILGRNSHKIITGGKNVFPTEVEAAIYATKQVKDVCVLGIDDRHWGQAVTAVYSLKADGNSNLLKQEIQSQLAKYKQPKNWIEVDFLPRNDRGKINARQLKAIAISEMKKSLHLHEMVEGDRVTG